MLTKAEKRERALELLKPHILKKGQKIQPSIIKTSPKYYDIKAIIEKYKDTHSISYMWRLIQPLDSRISRENFLRFFRKYTKPAPISKCKKKGPKHDGPRMRDRGQKDPAFFSEHFLGITLLPWQKKWIKNSLNNSKNILVPANQVGKTFMTAIKHIYLNFYKIGMPATYGTSRLIREDKSIEYLTLNLSPILKQARKLYKYIIDILQGRLLIMEEGQAMRVNECIIKEFLVKPKYVPNQNQVSSTPIQFSNGSNLWVASTGQDQASGLAGEQFNFISYDECCLSHHLQEELPGRIQSRLIKYGGNLDLIGTPDNKSPSRGYYLQITKKGLSGIEGWYAQKGKLDDNKYIPEANRKKIKQDIKSTDPVLYGQVIYGRFIEGTSATFLPYTLRRFFSEDLELEGPRPNHNYVIGVDWAMANDYTCMIVIDYTKCPYQIVHFLRYRGNEKGPSDQYTDLMDLKCRYNDAEVIMDTSSMGGKIIEHDLADIGAFGYNFGPGRKKGFIQNMKKYFYSGEQKLVSPYIESLEEELSIYDVDDKKLKQDSVMALGLCLYWLDVEMEETIQPFKADFIFR